MYRDGRGVPRDHVTAYMWLILAAVKGHPKAAEQRDTIGKHLTSKQITEAQCRAQAAWDHQRDDAFLLRFLT